MLEPIAASNERHERFVHQVLESGEVWGLKSQAGWAVAPSNDDEDSRVLPFWSDRAYAAQCAREQWQDYSATRIPLGGFCDSWLPGMHKDGRLVGTNWNAHLIGKECKAMELLRELEGG